MEIRKLVVRSTHASLETVLAFMERLSAEHEWPEEFSDKILLASSEAATNAMDHGNHFDSSKDVMIEVHMNESSVVIVVEDEGEGFRRGQVADPLAEENLYEDHGRGLFIIEQLADSVTYEDEGRRVRLHFNQG